MVIEVPLENGAQKGAPFCFSGIAGESACLHHLEAGPQNL